MSLILTLLLSLSAFGAPNDASATIQQAQALAVKKDRQGAAALIRKELTEIPSKDKKNRARLIEALNQISQMFFTDKGQKAYEAGQSLMFDNPDMALNQFREALAMEDGNVAIEASVAKIHLAKQECEAASEAIKKSRALNPFAPEPAVLGLRVEVCQGEFELLHDHAKTLPPLSKWEEQFVQFLTARQWLEQKAPKKAFEILSRLVIEQPQFPESYIYLAHAGEALNKDTEAWLQKYVSLCKAVTTRERRRYSLEPKLCSAMKEAEDELAKKTADL